MNVVAFITKLFRNKNNIIVHALIFLMVVELCIILRGVFYDFVGINYGPSVI